MRETLEALITARLATNPKPCWTGSNSENERRFARMVEDAKGIAAKIGCPDVGVFGKDFKLKAVVEVKETRGRRVPEDNQLVMLAAFASFGIPSFVWSSPSEVIQINEEGKAQSVENDAIFRLICDVPG